MKRRAPSIDSRAVRVHFCRHIQGAFSGIFAGIAKGPLAMSRFANLAMAASTLAIVGMYSVLAAAEDPPKFWAVTGVASDDVLHLRDVPSADSKSLAGIPHNARGLKHLGCRRNQPPMQLWARMSQAARREALTQWCRVEFRGQQGWVAGRFLKRDSGPAR